jgi:hypothetical protein
LSNVRKCGIYEVIFASASLNHCFCLSSIFFKPL